MYDKYLILELNFILWPRANSLVKSVCEFGRGELWNSFPYTFDGYMLLSKLIL